jgi:hypothetical protein
MVSGLDLARAPRRARLTARKKGSGYENADVQNHAKITGHAILAMQSHGWSVFVQRIY